MSQYIVSARKYRPDSFGTLLGQDNIARTLSNSIRRGQLAHAYLFCGPRGVGKTTTARIFAKMINCAHPGPDMEPCGECESCVSFQEGRSYCIHELDAASNNSVEDIKALMEKVQVPPPVGKYSVYIIDEVHMLSPAAFNAFLKTLEEPPSHAIFILATTEKHKILPTILSRCQTYDFNRIGIPDMVRNLRSIADREGVTVDDESLHVIAAKADGAMRDALTIFDQTLAFCGTDIRYEDVIRNLNVLDYEYGFSLVDNFLSGRYGEALLTFNEVLAKGFNALHFVASLSSHLRDLVVARTAGLESLLELPESLKKRYQEQAARCPLQFLYDALGLTTACEAGYKAAVNPRLHIEFTLMRLSFLTGRPEAGATDTAPASAPAKPAAPSAPAPAAPKPAPALVAEPAPAAEQAPAVVPAPQDPPAPAKAPARARRTPKNGSSLSINALMAEKEQSVEETEAPVLQNQTLPADEAVLLQWPVLAQMYASRPRLMSAISTAKPVLSEQNGVKVVTFPVLNISQKQWVEETVLRELETNLRKLLSCQKVNIVVEVVPDNTPQERKPYLPEEKAKDLMARNPEVKAFVADFGLDTK